MDPVDHYVGLARLGHDVFIASVAPAALVRTRADGGAASLDETRESSVDLSQDTFVGSDQIHKPRRLELYPLVKKPNAPFPDMITIGRTPNNDVVLRDATVSRLHAFFRHRESKWQIADGGSKNGTFLDGVPLLARREKEVATGQTVKIGDLELTFYTAEELFKLLCLITS